MSTTAVVFTRSQRGKTPSFRQEKSTGRTISLLLIFTIVSAFTYFGYLQIASSGALGEKEQRRSEILLNSSYGPLAARSDFLINIGVILDSPIVGKGYDPQIDKSLVSVLATELAANGAPISKEYLDYSGVMHSFLLNAMVIGGVLAGLIWIYVLKLTGQAILQIKAKKFEGAELFLICNLCWSTLFSPYAGSNRFLAMISLAYLVQALQRKKYAE